MIRSDQVLNLKINDQSSAPLVACEISQISKPLRYGWIRSTWLWYKNPKKRSVLDGKPSGFQRNPLCIPLTQLRLQILQLNVISKIFWCNAQWLLCFNVIECQKLIEKMMKTNYLSGFLLKKMLSKRFNVFSCVV